MPFLASCGSEFVAPKCILRRDQFVRGALDGVESFRRAQAVRTDIARFAFDLLLDAGDADLEKLVEIRAEDGEEFDPLDQRLRRDPALLRGRGG